MKFILLVFSFVSVLHSQAQKRYPLQVQLLGDYTITLQILSEENRVPDYVLEFFNKKTQETLSVTIDSIDHVPCGNISAQFVNEKLGFIYETGGCYATYNWLYRTEDGGNTWKRVIAKIDNEFSYIRGKEFFMFNEKSGIVLWQMKDEQLTWLVTNDGGLTWTNKTENFKDVGEQFQYIIQTSFNENGIITLHVTANMQSLEEMKKNLVMIQSIDAGNSFYLLQIKN